MKKYLLVVLLIVATTDVAGQVLGGSSTYGSNAGLSIGVGTHVTFGRSFWVNDAYYNKTVVEPESYQPRLFNPICGVGWWSETPGDGFVFGYQAIGNYGIEKYQVGLGTENLTGTNKTVGLILGGYVGFHFGSQLTACVGVQDESRLDVEEGGRLNIFNSHNCIGLMAMVRYAFTEDYFLSLNASYGLFPLNDISSDWEKYKSIGTEGYYVTDSNLKTFSIMLGVGRGF